MTWPRTAILLTGIAAAAFATIGAPHHADAAGEGVVARVGTRTVTASELERRMSALPPFQLRQFGRSPDEIRKNFLERVVVRELILSEGAVADNLSERDDVQERIRGILRNNLLAQLRTDSANETPIQDEEVRAYFEANRGKFKSPPRISIWRILVDKREQAEALIEDAKKDLSPKHWTDLARDKSVDKSTSMRGGNLGFVAPDGTTGEPGMKVDPALFAAALRAKDGELVPEPVKEGNQFAVVWRRQGMRAVERTLDQEAPSIRQVLSHAKTEERVKALLERLRTANVAELHAELVDQVDVTPTGDLQPMRRPGSVPAARHPAAAPPGPAEGPGGLR